MIRPAAITLCSKEGDEHDLLGTVCDVAFRGRGYEHAVELAEGHQISGIFAATRVGRGERVGLRLDPDGCLVFPDTGNLSERQRRPETSGRPAAAELLGAAPGAAFGSERSRPDGSSEVDPDEVHENRSRTAR